MKTSIKAIIGTAVTAAMATGIVVTATADMAAEPEIDSAVNTEEIVNTDAPAEEEVVNTDAPAEVAEEEVVNTDIPEETEQIYVKKTAEQLEEELRQLPADIQRTDANTLYTGHEMKLLERLPTEKGEVLCLDLVLRGGEPISAEMQQSTDIKLTKIEDSGYHRWEGRFVVSSVTGFNVLFTDPLYINCTTGTAPKITGKNSLEQNYKSVKAVYTYREYIRGVPQLVSYTYETGGTSQSLSLNPPSGNWVLVEATYYFTINAGAASYAPVYEQAIVHVVNSSYAQSAAYAQNSYAGLIDKYTYVYTGELEEDCQTELLPANELWNAAPGEAYTSFEEKVLSGFGTYEEAKNNKDENGYVNIGLVPLTVEDCAFDINGSRFFLTAPDSFMTSFNEPESFKLSIGTEGKMTAESDYSSNPMCVKIVITYDENGETITKTLNYSGVGEVNAPLVWDGDESPAEIAYFYYMEDGSGNIVESAAVDLVRVE